MGRSHALAPSKEKRQSDIERTGTLQKLRSPKAFARATASWTAAVFSMSFLPLSFRAVQMDGFPSAFSPHPIIEPKAPELTVIQHPRCYKPLHQFPFRTKSFSACSEIETAGGHRELDCDRCPRARKKSDAQRSHSRRFANAEEAFELGEAFGVRTLRVAFSLPPALGKLSVQKTPRRWK